MLITDMKPGMYAKSKDSRYFRRDKYSGKIVNDLGITVLTLGNITEVEEIEPWDNRLWENESFEVVRYSEQPNQRILLRKKNGVRFLADVRDYRIEIVFCFKSFDPRVDYGSAQWVGQFNLINIMKTSHENFITYSEIDKQVVLNCNNFKTSLRVKSILN